MSKFSGDPKTKWITESGSDRYMLLVEEFSFTDREGKVWNAPKGAVIDGASIPKALWSIVGPPYVGDYRRASIVHDVACVEAKNKNERRAADRMFYQACRSGGCSRRASIILYLGVRIGAWWRYKYLLQQEYFEPRIIESEDDRILKALFQSISEEVLQQVESDDIEEIEIVVDNAEHQLEEDSLKLFSSYSSINDFNEFSDNSEKEKYSTELLGPEHPYLPLSAEQYYKIKEPKSPCGIEDRVACEDTTHFPYSAICYLIINKSFGRSYRGTGFFISPDTIVTAGHCLKSGLGAVRSIQIVPGRMGKEWPFGSVWAKKWYVPIEWSRRGDVRFDYGVIKLKDSSLGKRTGHFKLGVMDDNSLKNSNLTTSGYPSDLRLSTLQHYNSGPCGELQQQQLNYMLDTWKGSSGSPVWVEKDGEHIVVGIHNYGHCPNKATRVNDRVYSDLKNWIE
ncbi:MAG: DUF1353 domain-containing protein [Pseudoalteromonas sp.]|uniref:DUF1353 domain-containing protein n=1 Tax=Pseudoalteromonas sp. TaxID=53249 RepID=UPI0025D9728F|nr:DUF1353 domain-containing protein [Pseudoalteromonas sp.]MCH2089150.1 DUF1353 domain-containing protein [Pseudoalteromonas sp.]